LSGHPAESRKKREATASDAQRGSGGGGKSTGVNPEIMATLCAKDNEKWGCNQWVNEGKAIVEPKSSALLEPKTTLFATSGQSNAVFSSDVALTLNANNDLPYVTHAFKVRGGSEDNTGEQGGTPGKKAGKGYLGQDEKAFTIGTTQDQQIAQPIAFKEPCPTITAKMQGSSGWAPYNETDHLVGQPVPFRKAKRAQSKDDNETWVEDEKANTINTFDVGDVRTTQAVVQPIAVDVYNQSINATTHHTLRSDASHNEYGAVLQPMSVDFRHQNLSEDVTGTIQSKPNGGYSLNYQPGILQPNISPTITQCKGSRGGSSMEALDEVSAIYAQQPTMAIRRLTPTECERLQGFPDDWTLIPYRNKPADQCPDGPRYKACGNSMAVPVMRWIGERIQMVESILAET
jgi:site-specific DNA-cytosine methylase